MGCLVKEDFPRYPYYHKIGVEAERHMGSFVQERVEGESATIKGEKLVVGTKGRGRTTKHRAFTYAEKRFNDLGRSGLIDYFKPKFSAEKIQDFMLVEHKQEITLSKAKQVARVVREKVWQENEEERLFTEAMVDGVIHFGNQFEITNIEAFALTCHLHKVMGRKESLTNREYHDLIERTLQEVNKLRLENWVSL